MINATMKHPIAASKRLKVSNDLSAAWNSIILRGSPGKIRMVIVEASRNAAQANIRNGLNKFCTSTSAFHIYSPPDRPGSTRKLFGNFWILLADTVELLGRRHRSPRAREDLAQQINF
jgi:hypothetical protein